MIMFLLKLFLTTLFLPGSLDLLHKIKCRWVLFRQAVSSKSPQLLSDYRSLVILFLLKSKSLNPNFSNPSPTHLKNFGYMFDPFDGTRILFLLPHPPMVLLSLIRPVKLTFSIRLSLVFPLLILFPLLLCHWTLLRFAVKKFFVLLPPFFILYPLSPGGIPSFLLKSTAVLSLNLCHTSSTFPSPQAPSHSNGRGLLSFLYLKLPPFFSCL